MLKTINVPSSVQSTKIIHTWLVLGSCMASILAQSLIQIKEKPAAILDQKVTEVQKAAMLAPTHRADGLFWIVSDVFLTTLGGCSWCCTAWPSAQIPVSQWWSGGVIHGALFRSGGTSHTRLDLWVCNSGRAAVWAEDASCRKHNSGNDISGTTSAHF